MADAADPLCPLCGRRLGEDEAWVDRHHLVPRSEGGTESFAIHRVCHSKIHSLFSEKELARLYDTWDALRAHPEIARFVAWVRKQPIVTHHRHRRPRSDRRRR